MSEFYEALEDRAVAEEKYAKSLEKIAINLGKLKNAFSGFLKKY